MKYTKRRLNDFNVHVYFEVDAAKVAVLVECGQHWARETGEMAVACTLNYLRALGMCDPAYFEAHAGGGSRGRVWH